jgi:type IV fimbrial biogenesis protein FimT
MCSSLDGQNCAPSSVNEWKEGWLVFKDSNADGQFNEGEKLIAVSQGSTGISSLVGNASVQRFVFLPTGMMASGMATLEVVPRIGLSQRITVNRVGRVRLSFSNSAETS